MLYLHLIYSPPEEYCIQNDALDDINANEHFQKTNLYRSSNHKIFCHSTIFASCRIYGHFKWAL